MTPCFRRCRYRRLHCNPVEEQIEKAVRDLENRTLARINGDFARLVYLCSTRDYNTGRYHHAGLSVRFGETAADTALAHCHAEIFRRLLYAGMRELVDALQAYIQSSGVERERVLKVWQRLQAYHVLVPSACDPLSVDLFLSNVKLALAVLEHRDRAIPAEQAAEPAATQLP